MNATFKKAEVLRYFLSRGLAYHLVYLRWRMARLVQRLLPPDYVPELRPVNEGKEPDFLFEPDDVADLISKVPPTERQCTIDRANAVCRGEFSFRGRDAVVFEGAVDWRLDVAGNPDWRWDLNRHGFFEDLGRAWRYTGDARYGERFAELVRDWIAVNPPEPGARNWTAPFEVAFRINSWLWAWHLFRDCRSIDDATRALLRQGIATHCEFLYRNLELNARNNHLLLEAKALHFGALLLPEYPRSGRWKRRAEKHLWREIRHQFTTDGVHREMSTHYHRVVAGELLEWHLLMLRQRREIPGFVAERIRRMAKVDYEIRRPDGTLPLFGDSSETDTYARFSAAVAGPQVFGFDTHVLAPATVDEASVWRLCHRDRRERSPSAFTSRAFPAGGYYLMRSGGSLDSAMQMVIDAGPFGLDLDPHHGHADALSFDLHAMGRPWLVDSGVYSTHASWEWRRYFRGTASHNTVRIDGEDQSRLIDSRRATNLARVTCHRWSTRGDELEIFDASHDGYMRLPEPARHRRVVWFVRDRFWLIADVIDGQGQHRLESNLHCPDDVSVSSIANLAFRLASPDGKSFGVIAGSQAPFDAELVQGADNPVQGWRSRNSGDLRPAPTISYRAACALPATLYTLLVPDIDALPGVPSIRALDTEAEVRVGDDLHRFEISPIAHRGDSLNRPS